MSRVAYFVSPHGFGHAARACAVMSELARRRPALRFDVISTVPAWFFGQSLEGGVEVHRLATDVGLVQPSALEEDLEATVDRLEELYGSPRQLERLTDHVRSFGCSVVLCDIAPIGIAVAERLGLPSVLVENFTWDWVYEAYLSVEPRLGVWVEAMARLFGLATVHIQTEPVCRSVPAGVSVGPVSRRPRCSRADLRGELRIPAEAPLVLLTMGGVGWRFRSLEVLERDPDAYFVVPGGSDSVERRGRLLTVPFQSDLYHPDLVAACDVVVGKLGYSTVAETYHGGAALLYVRRPGFAESAVLESFVQSEMTAIGITAEELDSGEWLGRLRCLLGAPRTRQRRTNGAGRAAELILDRLSLS